MRNFNTISLLSATDPNNPNILYLKLITDPFANDTNVSFYTSIGVIYEFNVSTNTIVPSSKNPTTIPTINVNTMYETSWNPYVPYYTGMFGDNLLNKAIVLDNGKMFLFNNGTNYRGIEGWGTTKLETVTNNPDITKYPNLAMYSTGYVIDSPLPIS